MKKTLILSPILIVFFGIVLNFPEFLMGSPASIKNLIVTLIYIIVWTLILKTSSTSKNDKVMKFYSVFWILTLLSAIITGYVNITNAIVDWAIPFAIVFLTQWYGITFFTESFLVSTVIIIIASLIMVIMTLLSIKKG
ncbi:hypothetical protein [Sporosarcina sp. FA9]|uniref:hypothetical protein n=1 Tax=Sporosarcina sp. FA9 TaxID=3413030 RepID=UPI003F65F0DF